MSSDVIHLLPDSVANQIAAGEVIQRPASVIKELVENALDAGASQIQVVVKDAGRTSIQVMDNGKGMSPTDARLCFERHATSKIRTAQDLYALHTMGFRGEALASIAAVAQVELKTRREEDELGTLISINASVVDNQEPIVAPIGSSFSIKNLFFNIPARRKFLKSNDVELRHIVVEFERIALVHHEVAFTLIHNDTQMYNLPATTRRQRILNMFRTASNSFNQQLINVDTETELVHVNGFVGEPGAARKKNAIQFFFVNGRFMKHPYFHKAVLTAYENLIPNGENPNYFLYLTVEPSTIDVNVHPTKTEIKFENEAIIWKLIMAAVKESLAKSSAIPMIDFDQTDAPEIPVSMGESEYQLPEVSFNELYNPFDTTPSSSSSYPSFGTSSGGGNSYAPRHSMPSWEQLYAGFESASAPTTSSTDFSAPEVDFPYSEREFPPEEAFFPPKQEEEPIQRELFSKHDVATSNHYSSFLPFKGKYLLTAVKSGLMIIDQRRAHLSVLFEHYYKQIQEKRGLSQRLLFPEMFELTVAEGLILAEIWDTLHYIGFDLSRMGGDSYSINAVPTELEGVTAVPIIQEMIHAAADHTANLKGDLDKMVALSLARSSAINYGQTLSDEEIQKLVDDLFATSSPGYTPDGKTTMHIISNDDLDKYFK